MSRVFWDTNLFIYLMEGSGDRARTVVSLRERMLTRGDELYTSGADAGGDLGQAGRSWGHWPCCKSTSRQ